LYLTYDDGPEPDHTPRLLDALAAVSARATFFLIGSKIQKRPDLVRRILDHGHAVGNHSFSHIDAWRSPASDVQAELDRTHALLRDVTGVSPTFVRPPFGHLTPSIVRWCRKNDQSVVLWDVMPADFRPAGSAASLAARIQSLIRPGSIVVLHDSPNPNVVANTAAATRLVSSALARSGWFLEAL
jgi:peptidoglycan/xylan/chitin deacetylase (PgdA/CDA1 family)